MRQFVLITSRPEHDEAQAEYETFLYSTGLTKDELLHIRFPEEPVPDFTEFSGVILGGSPYSFSTPPSQKSERQIRVETQMRILLTELIKQDFPFFGACYGIGALGDIANARISGKFAEDTDTIPVTVTTAGRHDPILAGVPLQFSVIVGHKEALNALPPQGTLLLAGQQCPVQMFKLGNNAYATQFHPELTVRSLRQRMDTYRFSGYFTAEAFQSVLSYASKKDLSIGSLILKNFVDYYGSLARVRYPRVYSKAS